MNILVFNCGSSSLKYRLIAMPEERELCGGEAQRVGPKTAEPPRIVHRMDGNEEEHFVEMPDHKAAFAEVMTLLKRDPRLMPEACGHRMVHGADRFNRHALLDDEVMAGLEAVQHMAPIHNPPATRLVRGCMELYPDLPQVIVFDTAFHATIPEYARAYALPRRLREEMGIRKYGFHGISHNYVTQEAARLLNKPHDALNAVSCHLGSGGASLCAVRNGRSVDNTMGYSPLQGLLMSTRCGDLDPALAMQLLIRADGDHEAVEKRLNKQSGVLGVSGLSGDIRDVLKALSEDDSAEQLRRAARVYLWRIRKYLGAYLAVVGQADAVIFTDTIGELVPEVRGAVCEGLQPFGVKVDAERNANATELPADIAADDSAVRVWAIQTNEELAIARQTWDVLGGAAEAVLREVQA